jgi:hypothetical protein
MPTDNNAENSDPAAQDPHQGDPNSGENVGPDVGSLGEEAEKLLGAVRQWAGFNFSPEVHQHLREAFSSLAQAASLFMETKPPHKSDDDPAA